jgi:DNA (cytosine-5)-methyltransferase 3A
MKILSLFDGISCARVACDRAGIPVEAYYASEIDKYAISISQKNYPDILQLGSVTDICYGKYDGNGGYDYSKESFLKGRHTILDKGEGFDLLIGGSPCQDLSIAKKDRQGLSGSRSGLFYEYVRILNEVKPKYFVLENVNSMPKEAKKIITEELFGIEPIMINAALVSAQNRKRLFWVGKLVGDTYEKVDINLPEDQGILLRDILEQEVYEKYYVKDTHNYERKSYGAKGKILKDETKSPTLQAAMGTGGGNNILIVDNNGNEKLKSNTIRTSGRGSGVDDKHNWDTIRIGQFNNGGQGDRIYSPEGKSDALSANGGGRGAKTGLYCVGLIDGKNSQGKRVYSTDGKSVTLSVGSKAGGESGRRTGVYLQNEGIRKLTPIECERLQSLPDNYTEGVSNTQRYKALGNAFNVEVVAHILKHLK